MTSRSPCRSAPEPAWSQGINAIAPSIGFDRIGRVRRGTVVGTREGTGRRAVGGAGSGVGDPQGDQPVTVGDPEIHQQVAAAAEAGTEAVAAAAVAGRTRRDLAGPGGWCVAAVDRVRAWSGAVDDFAGSAGQRRCALLSRLPGGPRCAPPSSSAETSQAGAVRTAPRGGGGQARAALVTTADLGLARSSLP